MAGTRKKSSMLAGACALAVALQAQSASAPAMRMRPARPRFILSILASLTVVEATLASASARIQRVNTEATASAARSTLPSLSPATHMRPERTR